MSKQWMPLPDGKYQAEEDSKRQDWPTAISIDGDTVEVSNTGFRLRGEYRLCRLVEVADAPVVPDAMAEIIAESLAFHRREMPRRFDYHKTVGDWYVARIDAALAWLSSQKDGNDGT